MGFPYFIKDIAKKCVAMVANVGSHFNGNITEVLKKRSDELSNDIIH